MSPIRPLDSNSKTFLGVQFVLTGFDPVKKLKVTSKLVDGGGVDVGQYGPNCTHVIVDHLNYDDPICVTARNDGKTLVTSLWVEHCFDVGMPIDPSLIVYRPLKDLNGIPGAKSLIVCLTGYQGQDRDDIMTMVGLIGANFSKPLVASKVTHLICFKFEGEKYELAKKTKRIKLVNHRWLQDCLKAWEILPETDYFQSGYDLEIMEAVAKDSQDTPEALDMYHNGEEFAAPSIRRKQLPKLDDSMDPLNSHELNFLSNTGDADNIVSKNLHQIHNAIPKPLVSPETRTLSNNSCGNEFASTSKGPKRSSPCSKDSKKYAISYSRKKLKGTTPPLLTDLSTKKSFSKGTEDQKDSLIGKSPTEIYSDEQAEPLASRMFGKKFMRCRRSLDKGNTTDEKGSVSLNSSALQNNVATNSIDLKLIGSKELEMAPLAVEKTDYALNSGNKVESIFLFKDDESEIDVEVGKEQYTEVGPDKISDRKYTVLSDKEEKNDATEKGELYNVNKTMKEKKTKRKNQTSGKHNIKIEKAKNMTEMKDDNIPQVEGEIKGTMIANNLRSCVKLEKADPVLFILSGNKLQRKEFQQTIRCLKGRVVCGDSHHWSYKATHFIVPYPIRRTEKFCAAAASGRWILKSDYLTASKQEGRLLAEEPYEWHENSLTEDGVIDLQAPRKWRLLREKTGHGAFYGMRIIIYGDCFVPPLDTLKRFVKAGDGTILATSPPYDRPLKSGVDFVIVSAGIRHDDTWVEEFIRHEIPCVVPDYLVEFVCKPGYSLERHVQFNTHVWADTSFKNHVNRIEDIGEDAVTEGR